MLIVLIYCAALCFGWMPESQKRRMNFIKDVRFFTRFSGLPTNLVSSFPLPKPMEVTLLSNVPTFPRMGRLLRAAHKVVETITERFPLLQIKFYVFMSNKWVRTL